MDRRQGKEAIEHTGKQYSFGGEWLPNRRKSTRRKGVERRFLPPYNIEFKTCTRSGNERRGNDE